MIDATAAEQAALRRCLPAFGEAAAAISFQKPLGDYSEAEALQVVDAIVTAYTTAIAEHHAATAHPPVQGLAQPSPLADFPDDLPWSITAPVHQGRR